MRRAIAVLAVTVAAGVLCLSSVAWACTPQARIVAASPSVGPPLSEASVRGEAVTPEAEVEIRWNGVKGPLVGTTIADKSGRFTAPVAVPEAAPGVYTLVAIIGEAGLTRTAFEVTPASAGQVPSGTPASPWSSGPGAGNELSGAGSNPGMALGVGVLALGLVGVFGGFVVVSGRRRRVPDDSSR